MDEIRAAVLFGALSNPDRLRVLRALVRAGPDGLAAGEIAAALGATPPRASFHLAALSEVGFVRSEREARTVRYRVAFDALGGLMRYLLTECCADAPALRRCCGF
jgi:ArsR family transcriptional regulator, arsenate/arsenite/antimonite-responsive transcriptional repressor